VPYQGPHVQSRPRSSPFNIFIVIAVVFVVIVGIGLGVVYSMLKSSSGPNTIRVTANQYYEGDLDRALLLKVLKNESYDPDPTSPTNSIINFRPYCGQSGSEEANTTRALFTIAQFYANGDNTSIKLITHLKSNSEENRNMLEDATNCAFDKLAQIMKDDVNMSLAFQKIDMKKFTTPGFETVVVVSVIAIVVGVRWKRMRKQA
jgi:hypothetical protein